MTREEYKAFSRRARSDAAENPAWLMNPAHFEFLLSRRVRDSLAKRLQRRAEDIPQWQIVLKAELEWKRRWLAMLSNK